MLSGGGQVVCRLPGVHYDGYHQATSDNYYVREPALMRGGVSSPPPPQGVGYDGTQRVLRVAKGPKGHPDRIFFVKGLRPASPGDVSDAAGVLEPSSKPQLGASSDLAADPNTEVDADTPAVSVEPEAPPAILAGGQDLITSLGKVPLVPKIATAVAAGPGPVPSKAPSPAELVFRATDEQDSTADDGSAASAGNGPSGHRTDPGGDPLSGVITTETTADAGDGSTQLDLAHTEIRHVANMSSEPPRDSNRTQRGAGPSGGSSALAVNPESSGDGNEAKNAVAADEATTAARSLVETRGPYRSSASPISPKSVDSASTVDFDTALSPGVNNQAGVAIGEAAPVSPNKATLIEHPSSASTPPSAGPPAFPPANETTAAGAVTVAVSDGNAPTGTKAVVTKNRSAPAEAVAVATSDGDALAEAVAIVTSDGDAPFRIDDRQRATAPDVQPPPGAEIEPVIMAPIEQQ